MPNDILTDELISNYASNPKDKILLNTVQIGDINPLYLISDFQDHDITLENGEVKTFKTCPFLIELPEIDIYQTSEMLLQIDNIDRAFLNVLDEVINNFTKIYVYYRPYIVKNSTLLYNRVLKLTLTDIEVNNYKVSIRAKFLAVLGKTFPIAIFSSELFPILS